MARLVRRELRRNAEWADFKKVGGGFGHARVIRLGDSEDPPHEHSCLADGSDEFVIRSLRGSGCVRDSATSGRSQRF
jgi:hypothetical protein